MINPSKMIDKDEQHEKRKARVKNVISWAIILLISWANVWSSYFLVGLIAELAWPLLGYLSTDIYAMSSYVVALAIWLIGFKVLPRVSIPEALGKTRRLQNARVLMHTLALTVMFWPMLAQVIYKSIRYRKVRGLGATFGSAYTSKYYTVTLNADRFQIPVNGVGLTKADLNEYMFLDHGEYLIKDSETLTYLLVSHSPIEIAKSFGYFGGHKDISSGLSLFDFVRCPLRAEAARCLMQTYDETTEAVVSKYLHFL